MKKILFILLGLALSAGVIHQAAEVISQRSATRTVSRAIHQIRFNYYNGVLKDAEVIMARIIEFDGTIVTYPSAKAVLTVEEAQALLNGAANSSQLATRATVKLDEVVTRVTAERDADLQRMRNPPTE